MSDQAFNRLKDCRHGRMLYNINDQYIGRSFDLYGEFSEGEIQFFQQFIRPGHVVLDVGANIGAHTVWLAKQTWPNGAVMAFEPQRLVFQTLCANLALNNIINTIAHQQCVGAAAGTVKVPVIEPHQFANYGGVGEREFTRGDAVPLVRLDDLELPRCNFIKIDVEGMELAVIEGAASLIARQQPWLYVENDREDKAEALVSHIKSMGYGCYWHVPPLFNPDNFFGHKENVFPNVASINMLCVPQAVTVNGLPPVQDPRWSIARAQLVKQQSTG